MIELAYDTKTINIPSSTSYFAFRLHTKRYNQNI